ncbi:MAG: helix-turn-helix transcriptional regulator [Clostridia bacterium]|nr:helix-turn-helix transcriptional regulator [Clostridia bacterium]
MKIVKVGCNYRHSEKFVINRPCGSGDWVLLVVRTKAFFTFGEKTIISDKNAVMMYRRGTPQHYGAYGEGFANDWIHFELSDDEEAEITALGIPFDTVLYPSTSSELSAFINGIFTERHSSNPHRDEAMELYFRLILMKLSDGISPKNATDKKPFYTELTALRNEIASAPTRTHRIEDMCRSLGISRSYLQHLYKQYFGVSVVQDIKLCRMEYAKYLLSGTDMTVSNIAFECGYATDVHFMRTFKKSVGISPTDYRKINSAISDGASGMRSHDSFRV